MQYVNQVAGTVVGYATGKVGEQLGYLFDYKRNIKKLKEQLVNLEDRRERVQRQIQQAEDNLETIERDVQHWVKGVDAIISDTKKFVEADEEKANHRCFNGWCINLFARHKFGKEAFEKASEITKLHETKFETVAYRPPLSDIVSYSSSKIFEGFESRKSTVRKIMKALDNENINVIGICGMGGVGKTTIVEEVCQQAKEEKKFDKIVMVVVSQTPNLMKIQDEVAKKLGLNLENLDEPERLAALKERIMREKKIVIILDDVWSKLELREQIGIPSGGDHMGCKILLTSRSKDVCNKMDAQEIFPIKVLDEEEAWVLFRQVAGEVVDSPNLNRMAREVARECGGLPMAIVTVGSALKRNDNLDVWKDAARQLKKSAPIDIEGMDAKVYSV